MRIPRLYQPGSYAAGDQITLDATATQHITKALRLKTKDALVIFNGSGKCFEATIITKDSRTVIVAINNEITESTESPLKIHLGLAISKGERMDYAIQKTVEAGVHEITPILTEHTVVKLDEKRKQSRTQHWNGIVRHACEQSGRNLLVPVHPVTSLDHWLESVEAELKLIMHTKSDARLGELQKKPSSVCVLIGPEGGFSENEIQSARQKKFISIKLGPRIFRAETAAVAACTVLQTLWGDLI